MLKRPSLRPRQGQSGPGGKQGRLPSGSPQPVQFRAQDVNSEDSFEDSDSRSCASTKGWFRDRQVSDRESGKRTFALWRKWGRLLTVSFWLAGRAKLPFSNRPQLTLLGDHR